MVYCGGCYHLVIIEWLQHSSSRKHCCHLSAAWDTSQLFAGKLGDHYCKKQILTIGMLLQAAGILLLVIGTAKLFVIAAMVLMGLGTGIAYPNFLTVIAENLSPVQRSKGLSIFRFWRDLGYVAGALGAGLIAQLFSIPAAFTVVAVLTAAAGITANVRMCCTFKLFWRSHTCTEAAAY